MSRIFDMLRKSEREAGNQQAVHPRPASPSPARLQEPNPATKETPLGLEYLESVVPQIAPEKHIVSYGENRAPGAEKFRVLRHRLQKMRSKRPMSKLLVSSAVPKEGKTFVAVNLAFSLAKVAKRVLLIDADLRKPGVQEVLGLGKMSGLAELLQGESGESEVIRRIERGNLYYLPAGHPTSEPGELLQEARVGDFLQKVGEVFDWVVVDSAPITLFADTLHLAGLLDASVLVTRVGITPSDEIAGVLRALEGTVVAGIVLNGDRDAANVRYSYYTHSYGDVEGKSSERELPAEEAVPHG